MNKRVNKIKKIVDGPTQMSRRRRSVNAGLFIRLGERHRTEDTEDTEGGSQVLGFPRFPIVLVLVVVLVIDL